MNQIALAPYRVEAYNTAQFSENKIHDDEVARRYGFSGGLVPGVDVYAYMTHAALARWGRAWLERGRAECRFVKPVYEGETATVLAVESDGGLAITVESRGETCASGTASMTDAPAAPKLDDFAEARPPAVRPAADEQTLKPGTHLGIAPFRLTVEFAAQYLREVRESEPIYAREGLVHPGTILRLCNWALAQNVVLGPWIHVGSKLQNFAAARVGDELTVRARVTDNYEHKGHRFVELDALAIANGATVLARIAHTAIYRPRQVDAAA
jgi:acyl-coenzyme A thioesterase PaaI-like protein